MKAVNLIPPDSRRGARVSVPLSPSYLVLGALALVLAFVAVYVLSANAVSSRRAKLATLNAQLAQERAAVARTSRYAQFAQLAQTRAQTVQQIAAARFNWYQALNDLSKVVPSNASLRALTGTVVPSASPGGGGTPGGATGSLRGEEPGPAFQLSGCAESQDDVARLMSRLRVIEGVTRVTLSDSQKPGGGAAGTTSAGSSAGCGASAPSFDLIVFFAPVPNAGANGAQSVSATPVSAAGGAR